MRGHFRFLLPQQEYIRVMNKTYQFRLYPTKKQQTTLNEWLALCCEVYNAALQERRDAYRVAGVSLGYAHQSAELPACKQVRPELFRVNSQVVQDAVKRVDRASAAVKQARRRATLAFGLAFAMIASPSSNMGTAFLSQARASRKG